MADELFRFVHLRGAIPAEADDNLLIRAWSDPPSDLESQLVAAAEAGEDPTLIARQWLSEARQESPFAALRRLDAAMTGPVDNVTVERLRDAARQYLDTDEVLDRARGMAQDALIAVALTPDLPFKDRDTAHRLVILAVAGQKALQRGTGRALDDDGDQNGDGEDQRRDQALRDILTRGVAVLPGRVSQLLGLAPAQQQERRPQRRPQTAALPIDRRRDAALAELVAIAVDPDVAPEVSPAIVEPPPDEADPRLRPTGETTVRPARVLLRDAVRERLSEATRTLLDQVAPGQTDLLSAISAVERASL